MQVSVYLINIRRESVIAIHQMQGRATATCVTNAVLDRHNVIMPAVHNGDGYGWRLRCQILVPLHEVRRSQDKEPNRTNLPRRSSRYVPAHT